MIKINVSDEKLLDELTLVLKLFFDSEEIENLNYEFNIEQNVVDLDIETKLTSNFDEKEYVSNEKIIDSRGMSFVEKPPYIKSRGQTSKQ